MINFNEMYNDKYENSKVSTHRPSLKVFIALYVDYSRKLIEDIIVDGCIIEDEEFKFENFFEAADFLSEILTEVTYDNIVVANFEYLNGMKQYKNDLK